MSCHASSPPSAQVREAVHDARHWYDIELRKVEDEPIPRFPRWQVHRAAAPRERGYHHRGLVEGHEGGAVAAAYMRPHDDTSG
jgi:hypothetical protein